MVTNCDETMHLIDEGDQRRTIAATRLNDTSKYVGYTFIRWSYVCETWSPRKDLKHSDQFFKW